MAALPVACAVVRVSVPAVSEPNEALGTPSVGTCPFIVEVFESVASLERRVTVTV